MPAFVYPGDPTPEGEPGVLGVTVVAVGRVIGPDGQPVATEATPSEPETAEPAPTATLAPWGLVEAPDYGKPDDPRAVCACGEDLAHRDAECGAILHVHERGILRPHFLADAELPFRWRCPACGESVVINI